MKAGIYQITNTKSQRIYIGSSWNVQTRMRAHRAALRRGIHCNYLLQRSFAKHGESCFSFEQILICREDDRLEYEQAIINALSPAYNICKIVGSTKGLKITPEGLANMRAAWKRVGMTEARVNHLAYMTSLIRGRKKPPMSEEQKAKISASLTGKKQSAQTRLKKSVATKGRPKSEEHKRKISEAHKGKKRPEFSAEWREKLGASMRGKSHSPETIKKIADARRGKTLTDEVKKKRLDDMRRKKAANQ